MGQPDEPDADARFAAFLRELGDLIARREAANPTPPQPPEPWIDKPGTLIAAEKEVMRAQVVEKIQLALCGGPKKCQLARCRRSLRCAEIEDLRPIAERARAKLAAELAKWKPPPAPPESQSRKGRRRPQAR